jgi:hypothetical protein
MTGNKPDLGSIILWVKTYLFGLPMVKRNAKADINPQPAKHIETSRILARTDIEKNKCVPHDYKK